MARENNMDIFSHTVVFYQLKMIIPNHKLGKMQWVSLDQDHQGPVAVSLLTVHRNQSAGVSTMNHTLKKRSRHLRSSVRTAKVSKVRILFL